MSALNDIRRTVGPAPARLVWSGSDPEQAGARGALLFVHGLGVDIGIQTQELHAIARAGFLAVGLDALGHGVRRWPDFDARFGAEPAARERVMFELVRDTADEVPAIVDALLDEGLCTPKRVGMGGISMGGFVTYRARVVEPRLSVLLPILASPMWPVFEELSPHAHIEKFFPAALLSQTAADDEVVVAAQGADFAAALHPRYAARPELLRHVEFDGERHAMSEEAWNRLWGNLMQWLADVWPPP